ncbi:hypothetical protein G4G28_00990 [Massilia sp. Dwa41.01b]|uniref:hypothetical protein n=1 Tax=unclassified Massilia TaxID=2609279 RepID=UPI00160097FC|nr:MULTISPECIES: hypothetical protein [unclassified Massilia]QNA87403.1 hypothetical protein G4G28_00990 [Massilia sp. Dwa41.01b]QNA98309.1 hypothetical protein G4G31_04750 [Massilia sp. Se16.2.3]
MTSKIALRAYVLLLVANTAIVSDALACRPVTPERPIVEIAPKSLLAVYRAAYHQAGFQYVNENRFRNHIEMHFKFALPGFAERNDGKLDIAFDLGASRTCNPCGVHLMHVNVGDDYGLEQYGAAQKLIRQKLDIAESELVRQLGDKIKPTPRMASCVDATLPREIPTSAAMGKQDQNSVD